MHTAFNQAAPIISSPFFETGHGAVNRPAERQLESSQQYQTSSTSSGFQSSHMAPYMPSPSISPLQLPPPPQSEAIAHDLYNSNQEKNLPAPPPSFALKQQQQQRGTFDYQQPTGNLDPFNVSSQAHSWQNGLIQNPLPPLQQNQTPASDSLNSQRQLNMGTEQHRDDSSGFGSSSRFFENHEMATNEVAPEIILQQHQTPANAQHTDAEPFYPENRERLDDISTPTGSSSFTDRHNYLVTGQLSQERISLPQAQHHTQLEAVGSYVEDFPPPGLSRMVVGQPENNQDQNSVPPGLNRLVTGTETTPSSYINYQRQADGEVSHSPTPNPFSNTLHHSNVTEVTSSSDRNLYLVAGESDANNQRVIPGSHSNLSATNVIASIQSLHIQDDSNINVSAAVYERSLNVDGMETVAIDNEPREEDIDGANDNTENVPLPPIDPNAITNEHESDVREEAIEGANAEVDKSRVKQKSDIGISSDDSELRALERTNVKPKPRRSKKYDEESNDSEVSEGQKREKYRNQSRDKTSKDRDEYRRRDGDRRQRKGDDTDGSKYGDSKRRTDDEEENRKTRKKSSRRLRDGEEVDEKERKKREKYRDPRRSKNT